MTVIHINNNSAWRQSSSSLSLLFLFLALLQSTGAVAGEVPVLNSNKDVAEAGFFKLSWQESIGDVEIEEATNRDFSNSNRLYPGSDNATVISGKPNGTWYYRARSIDDEQAGSWSEVMRVTVVHHSLQRALFFFSAGLVMFVATCWLVIRGDRLA